MSMKLRQSFHSNQVYVMRQPVFYFRFSDNRGVIPKLNKKS